MRRALLAFVIASLLPASAIAQGISQLNQWKTVNGSYLTPLTSTYGLLLPGLATSTTGCLSVGANGWISPSGSGCGGSSTPYVATSSLKATYPVVVTPTSAAVTYSLDFGTTTANTWSGLQAFSNVGTTTFAGGIDFTRFNFSATSTGSQGINLSGGCFALRGTCLNGTVTSITAGSGLNGGTITTNGTLSLASYFATSSADTAGALMVFGSTNGWPVKAYAQATSTLTPSSPLTGSFTQIGSSGSLGCQTASAAQAGCLSASDWAKFNMRVATSTAEIRGQVAYWATTSGSPATLASAATSSIASGTGITVTNGASAFVIGSQPTVNCNTASASAQGCLTASDWSAFNMKVATSSSETAGQLAYFTTTNGSPAKIASAATSSYGVSSGFSYSGTTGALVGGTGGTLSQIEHRCFTYATSTAWTGTTTIPLETGYGEVWNSVTPFTDAGTLNLDFYHASSHLNLVPASTTNGTVTVTSNTTFTSGDKTFVDIGTPASSPTKINVCVKDTI